MLIITVRWFLYRLSECSSYNFPVIIFNNLHDLQRGSGRSFTLRQEDCSILKVRCYLLFELIHSTAKNLKSHRRKEKKWKPNCPFLKYCPRAFIWMDTSLRILSAVAKVRRQLHVFFIEITSYQNSECFIGTLKMYLLRTITSSLNALSGYLNCTSKREITRWDLVGHESTSRKFYRCLRLLTFLSSAHCLVTSWANYESVKGSVLVKERHKSQRTRGKNRDVRKKRKQTRQKIKD